MGNVMCIRRQDFDLSGREISKLGLTEWGCEVEVVMIWGWDCA